MSGLEVRRDLRTLKRRFDAALESYEKLRESSERSVVHWVWATAPRYNIDPLFFLNREESVGRVVPSPPENPEGWVAYGFSPRNRIVVERRYLIDLPGRYYQGFYFETEDRVLGYYFHHELTLGCINCTQLVFAESVPAYYQKWAIGGWASHTYITSNGKIRAFADIFKEDDEPQKRLSGELRYGGDGRIEVRTKWPGSRRPELTFRGMLPAENPFLRSES